MIEIPGYKIHRQIDSSDYCNSYSAIQLSTGRTMVVSIFSHSVTQYTSFQSFFNKIEKNLARNVFGVICPIKEFIKTPHHTYIISDLLSNSCQNIYKDKTVDIENLFNEIYKIALSLDLYHKIDFYHGGVSLDNIFHDNHNNLILGLAAFNQNLISKDNALNLNRESYKAPENETSSSKSHDFYALGVVLYELIFKQKPYIASSIDQLNKLKSEAIIHIPDSKLDHLKPLFSTLLSSNPNQRMATATDFRQIALSIDIKIDELNYKIQPLSVITNASEDKATIVKKKIPTLFYYGTAALVLAAIAMAFFPSAEKDIFISDDINLSEDITEEPPKNDNYITNETATIIYDESDFKELIESAKLELKHQQFATALMSINQALMIHPNHQVAINIQQKIQTELKINAIIQQAEVNIKQGFLVSPASNNALAHYKKLQKILPKGDKRAMNGLQKISDQYFSLALKQHNSDNNQGALKTINNGLAITPKHNSLKKLHHIIVTQKAQQQKIQQAKILEEENNRLAFLELKKQQEQQEQQEQQKTLQRNQIKQQFEEKRNSQLLAQQKIDQLYTTAENHLKDTQLTVESINKAIENLRSLEGLASNTARNLQLKLKIDNAYISLAQYQISINDDALAQSTINKGLAINHQNPQLLSLNNQINIRLSQQKIKNQKAKEKERLPIFGTF